MSSHMDMGRRQSTQSVHARLMFPFSAVNLQHWKYTKIIKNQALDINQPLQPQKGGNVLRGQSPSPVRQRLTQVRRGRRGKFVRIIINIK